MEVDTFNSPAPLLRGRFGIEIWSNLRKSMSNRCWTDVRARRIRGWGPGGLCLISPCPEIRFGLFCFFAYGSPHPEILIGFGPFLLTVPPTVSNLARRNRSDFCDLRYCDAHRGPQKSQRFPRQEKAMLHCDLRVRWKVASDLRFWAAISEPQTPSFCRISGDLAPSTRKSLAIVIVRFWCAKVSKKDEP